MNIFAQLRNDLVDAITNTNHVLGIDNLAIFARQNGPEPTSDYVMINVLRVNKTGRAQNNGGYIEFKNGTMKEYTTQHYEVVVQLSFFGEGSADAGMGYYSQFAANTRVRECFIRKNLSPRSISELRSNPQLRETTWVDSYALDMTLGFAVQTVQDIDWADYITVNNQTIPLI